MVAPGSSPPDSPVADRYLTVHLEEIITLRRWGRLRHRARPVVAELLTGWLGGGFEQAKEPTKVIVARRSDGVPLLTYDYDYRLEAVGHRDSLRERFGREHIFDVCRQLGLDMTQVGTPHDD